ncbi:TPA: hypothetical protein EYP26_06300, partial [Candidatus Bathyarchaeota archaeon]|nr:hypothetical protein [Candidatus Bathyarchaeota archaeon]
SADGDVSDTSLWGIRFEYKDYTSSGGWVSIGVHCDHTLEEIGEEFNLSRERIRQILLGH